jgi:predicted peptidase
MRPRPDGATATVPSGRVPGPRLDPDSIRPPSNEIQGELVARMYQSPSGERMPYRLYVPAGYDAGQPYPLVIFLHGSSGSGDDNRKQIASSGTAVNLFTRPESPAQYPCFVLIPQAKPRNGSGWVRQWDAVPLQNGQQKEPLVVAMEIIDHLRWEFAIDPSRLYLAGQSMGGFGTWIALTRYPETFAAAIPVAGGGNPAAVGENKTAVWAFHGSADRVVPVRRSRAMFDAFRKAGANPRYTEYKGVRHQSWRQAFVDPELLPWLFSQRRGVPLDHPAITSNRTTLAASGASQ